MAAAQLKRPAERSREALRNPAHPLLAFCVAYNCKCVRRHKTRLECCAYKAAKYSLEPLGSGFMVFSPGFQPAGQTSSGFSCTYWMACRMRSVSSTLRPKARLLIVACWMTPCAQRASAQVSDCNPTCLYTEKSVRFQAPARRPVWYFIEGRHGSMLEMARTHEAEAPCGTTLLILPATYARP